MDEPRNPIRDFLQAEGTQDWRLVADGATAFFRTPSFADSARFVQAISAIPGIEDHPPSIDVRADGVAVTTVTLTERYFGPARADIEVARQVSGLAREMGYASDPSMVQSLLVIPGAPDVAAIMPFWRAVLGYVPRADSPAEDMVDPRGRGAPFWFEQMEEPRADGGGSVHVSVWLPPEQAEERVAAAIAAGGRLVRDTAGSSWWTLADPAGNEVCVSNIKGRV